MRIAEFTWCVAFVAFAACEATLPPLDCSAAASTPFEVVQKFPKSLYATEASERVTAYAPPHGASAAAVLYIGNPTVLPFRPRVQVLRGDGSVEELPLLPPNSSHIGVGSGVVWGQSLEGPWMVNTLTKALTMLPSRAPASSKRLTLSDGSRLVLAYETGKDSSWEIEGFDEEGQRSILTNPAAANAILELDSSSGILCVHYRTGSEAIPMIGCFNSRDRKPFEFRFAKGDAAEPGGGRLLVSPTHIFWLSLRSGWFFSPQQTFEPKAFPFPAGTRFASKDPCGVLLGPLGASTGSWSFLIGSEAPQPVPASTEALVDTARSTGVSNEADEIVILRRGRQ